jgi:hypothetical protein
MRHCLINTLATLRVNQTITLLQNILDVAHAQLKVGLFEQRLLVGYWQGQQLEPAIA